MKDINSVEFKKYGKVLSMNVDELLSRLGKTEKPDGVIYVASSKELESTTEFSEIQNSVYGGMPIQIGFCNGHNNTLNAVEYHRDSEVNICFDGAKFILGLLSDINDDFTYDTAKMEIFTAPAGSVVEFYATTLHYAPCDLGNDGFRVAVVLPKGTNEETKKPTSDFPENKLLTHKNKWLIAHKDANIDGAFVGLIGENIKL